MHITFMGPLKNLISRKSILLYKRHTQVHIHMHVCHCFGYENNYMYQHFYTGLQYIKRICLNYYTKTVFLARFI